MVLYQLLDADQLLRAAYARVRQFGRLLGGQTISLLRRRGQPGGGFHSGGSFPMSTEPTGAQSDLAGRPHGLQRIHVVDSSVLPNIAASTITLSVMANAHRIGSEYQHYI